MFVDQAAFSTAALEDYRPFVGDETLERIRALAAPLAGARVLHVNATGVGGGVAEILLSLVPLMRDAGLDVDWYVLEAEQSFFEVTKSYHNALQGQAVPWSDESFDLYWRGCQANAEQLGNVGADYDFVIVHDPQPLVLRNQLPVDGPAAWIWRCHIDLTAPSPETWQRLSPHLGAYDMLVFTAPEYEPPGLAADTVVTALPCIDPFRPKNRELRAGDIRRVLRHHGVDPDRPYVLQVSRFDPWKDPLGVIEVYRRLKPEHPDLQLVYMASMAPDDPEGHRVYEEARRAAGDDEDVRLLALEVPPGAVTENALEVNAMQRGARVVLQKSIREGFGLVVAEALWKRRPVVAGNVGGIRYQIRDGESGFLVESVPEAADAVHDLLRDEALRERFGERGRATVAERFLFTRLLEQYLEWFRELRD